jgi:uncharacterized protein YaeQ
MATGATIYHLRVDLSDVDRGVYAALDLRIARHPSESLRYLITRALAYCLCYEEGITFSKGGLSDADEPTIAIRDTTGRLEAWIDIGKPSAERLHKASKAAHRVVLFTEVDARQLRREAASRPIHRLSEIEAWRLAPAFLSELEQKVERNTQLELTRTDDHLFVTVSGATFDTRLERCSLAAE